MQRVGKGVQGLGVEQFRPLGVGRLRHEHPRFEFLALTCSAGDFLARLVSAELILSPA